MENIVTVDSILGDVNCLTLEDKLLLLAQLNQVIKLEEKQEMHRAIIDKYIGSMKKLAGENFLSSHKRQDTQAKVVVAICLLQDGYKLITAAHILGVDHSTINHYKKVWDAVIKLPKVYSDVIKLYNKYRQEL